MDSILNQSWLDSIGFRGYYESIPIDVSFDADGAETVLTWNQTTPNKTSIKVQTSLSEDMGKTWSDWMDAFNGEAVPQINHSTSMNNARLKIRVIFETDSYLYTPSFSGISIFLTPVLFYDNIGDVNIKPEIWITKIGNGDISLINTSNNNEEFKFTGLINNEVIYVNNENEQIETSLATIYRYSNFNDNYLDIPVGVNIFKINGQAQIQFRSQYKVLM